MYQPLAHWLVCGQPLLLSIIFSLARSAASPSSSSSPGLNSAGGQYLGRTPAWHQRDPLKPAVVSQTNKPTDLFLVLHAPCPSPAGHLRTSSQSSSLGSGLRLSLRAGVEFLNMIQIILHTVQHQQGCWAVTASKIIHGLTLLRSRVCGGSGPWTGSRAEQVARGVAALRGRSRRGE